MLKNNFAPPGAPVLPVAAVLIFTFYRSTQCTNEWLPPSTAPTPYLCHVPRVPARADDRPRPPGARRPRPPAQGAARGPRRATHGRGSGSGRARNRARAGLPAHVTNMLRYNDAKANDSRGFADFRRVTVHRGRRGGLARVYPSIYPQRSSLVYDGKCKLKASDFNFI